MQKKSSRILKTLAILLVLVMAIGSIPASAKAKKVSVTGSSKKIAKAIGAEDSATVTIKSSKKKVEIPATPGSENKTLVIDAPNAKVYNKANFATVKIVAAKAYYERTSGNTITVSKKGIKVTVSKKYTVAKLTLKGSTALKVKKGASILNLACKKSKATVDLTVEKNATVIANLLKKTTLNVDGSLKALVGIINTVDGSTINAEIPVGIEAEADTKTNLGAKASGSILDKTSSAIELVVVAADGVVYVLSIDGQVISDGQTGTPSAIGVVLD